MAREISGETSAVASTPTLAWSSVAPWKARPATSSETVKPMPAAAAAPASPGQVTVSFTPPNMGRVASHDAPTMPNGLPTT